MGVGYPRDLVESVARGIDMSDCVLPTRNGRSACAWTNKGQILAPEREICNGSVAGG